MADYSTTTCVEEFGTVRETYDIEGGLAASVTLRCAWSDRHTLAASLVGAQAVWPYAAFADGPRAQSCAIRPELTKYAQDGQQITYEQALVDVQYGVSKIEGTDLVSESLEPTSEFITLDHKRFQWGAAGDKLLEKEAPGRQLKSLKLVRTLYNRASPLPTSIIDLVGSSNNSDYTSGILGLTFPTETLLFTVPGLTRTITTDGDKGWNVTVAFNYKPGGWNKFWRGKTGTYEAIYDIGPPPAEYKNFPPADFSDFLF